MYTLTYMDGMTPVAIWQAMNFHTESGQFRGHDVVVVASLQAAREAFVAMNRERGRDGIPSEGGGPWADVYRGETIEPDVDPWYRLTVGPRGGVQVTSH